MWSEAQSLLIGNLCQLSGLAEATAQIRQTVAIVVEGVAISLLPGCANDSLRIAVQLGRPPEQNKLEIFQKMLELNLVIDRADHQHLALDPETQTLLFIYEVRNLDAAQLLISLQRAAGCARLWQVDYFLEPVQEVLA